MLSSQLNLPYLGRVINTMHHSNLLGIQISALKNC